ncbi:MAG TPA: hypothetical protein VFP46_01905 [Candidatus Paceibacterota bacterium]|nr:hypothetical protein [Candidatus Paceibacterota bacterium]
MAFGDVKEGGKVTVAYERTFVRLTKVDPVPAANVGGCRKHSIGNGVIAPSSYNAVSDPKKGGREEYYHISPNVRVQFHPDYAI